MYKVMEICNMELNACKHLPAITSQDIDKFKMLISSKDYQQIEYELYQGNDDNPVGDKLYKFYHWMHHVSIEQIQLIFDDRIQKKDINIRILQCNEDSMLEGFLIYVL